MAGERDDQYASARLGLRREVLASFVYTAPHKNSELNLDIDDDSSESDDDSSESDDDSSESDESSNNSQAHSQSESSPSASQSVTEAPEQHHDQEDSSLHSPSQSASGTPKQHHTKNDEVPDEDYVNNFGNSGGGNGGAGGPGGLDPSALAGLGGQLGEEEAEGADGDGEEKDMPELEPADNEGEAKNPNAEYLDDQENSVFETPEHHTKNNYQAAECSDDQEDFEAETRSAILQADHEDILPTFTSSTTPPHIPQQLSTEYTSEQELVHSDEGRELTDILESDDEKEQEQQQKPRSRASDFLSSDEESESGMKKPTSEKSGDEEKEDKKVVSAEKEAPKAQNPRDEFRRLREDVDKFHSTFLEGLNSSAGAVHSVNESLKVLSNKVTTMDMRLSGEREAANNETVALQTKVESLEGKVKASEERMEKEGSHPSNTDLKSIEGRVEALECRPETSESEEHSQSTTPTSPQGVSEEMHRKATLLGPATRREAGVERASGNTINSSSIILRANSIPGVAWKWTFDICQEAQYSLVFELLKEFSNRVLGITSVLESCFGWGNNDLDKGQCVAGWINAVVGLLVVIVICIQIYLKRQEGKKRRTEEERR